jgi:hypothetical protein
MTIIPSYFLPLFFWCAEWMDWTIFWVVLLRWARALENMKTLTYLSLVMLALTFHYPIPHDFFTKQTPYPFSYSNANKRNRARHEIKQNKNPHKPPNPQTAPPKTYHHFQVLVKGPPLSPPTSELYPPVQPLPPRPDTAHLHTHHRSRTPPLGEKPFTHTSALYTIEPTATRFPPRIGYRTTPRDVEGR